jgi:hypothetical protein
VPFKNKFNVSRLRADILAGYALHGRFRPLVPRIPTPPFPGHSMILIAIFSVIVLLMCWLCYSGDCNH